MSPYVLLETVMLNGAPVLPAKMFTLVEIPESTVCSVPLVSLK